MADNGTPPIPFPASAQIPIVGQPCHLLSFVPTYMLQCACEGKHPLLVIGVGAIVQCPGCHRRFSVNALLWDRAKGLQVQLGLVLTPDEATQQLIAGGVPS